MGGNVSQLRNGSEGRGSSVGADVVLKPRRLRSRIRRQEPARVDTVMQQMHNPASVHVQARIRGVVLCGRLEGAFAGDDVDMFKVRTELGTAWTRGANVRLCGLDGRCECVRAAADGKGVADGCGGASCATPLGNTGGTVVEEGTR